ncbi:integrase core domain-containing protein [Herminiimonas sp. CN]|uniref:integrase core domain-containing protein n=1 Tax=Herminiimonas sp. CN TaxID=1349818 RepID=UPI00138DFC94
MDELRFEYPFAGARMLRDMVIDRPNQVRATDLTYIPMRRGFVCLHAYETVAEARARLGGYLEFFNSRRQHSSLDRQTPDMVYFKIQPQVQAA